MKFLREGSMSDVYYTFQDIANNPDYSDIDAIAQIKKVMSHPTDDAEQFVARKLKLMHDTIAKHPSYKNDPMGVYEEMLDMIRTEYHDETYESKEMNPTTQTFSTYESKEMNPTTQTFSEDNDTNSLEQWKADVRKQYPQQASQIKFKGKGFGDTIVAEIPGKDQAFGEFNMETGDAWVAPMDEGVAEGMDSDQRARLDDLIDQYRTASDPEAYYGLDDEYGDPDEIIALIRQEFGDNVANKVEAGTDKMHFPRQHHTHGYDPMSWKTPVDRQTKAGKMYKQDSDYRKNTIKSRYRLSGKSAVEGVAEGMAEAKVVGHVSDVAGHGKVVQCAKCGTDLRDDHGFALDNGTYICRSGKCSMRQAKNRLAAMAARGEKPRWRKDEDVTEGLDPDTQRLEQEVRDALANGDDYTAKSLVKMAQTAADRNHLRKIIRQAMYGTGPGQGGIMEGDDRQVVFSGTGANGGKYKIIQTGPTDFMIHANGKHIDTYSSLQRAMSVLKNEVPGLTKGVAEGVRGLYHGDKGIRPPQTQPERDEIARDIKQSRATNRADQTTTGYGNRVAPQGGAASSSTSGQIGAKKTDATGQTSYSSRNADKKYANYAGNINTTAGAGKGVAEGSSSPDVYKDRLASIQSLRYDNPQEYAKQYRALLRDMPEEHAAHANQAQKGSYSSGQRGSGTGRTGRVSEDSAQGTANKQAWDKGHEAGYTGNEKCPCKPGSAEEKAWNAGHKVGRDERSHERHGVKEGNMKSSENNPTGPSFAGGKWKGTDSAAQAKNKYVGEISEGTMPSVKLMRNIAEGLVRVDDLVLNRPVYGKPTDQDRRAVYRMVREFADAGIDYNDAVVELVEYFKHELSELAVAPTIPAVGGKPAIVAPTGTSVGSTTPPTANTAATTPGTVSSTAPGAAPVVAPPVTQQGVDALAQMVKNAGLSPSQISTLMSKAK